VINPTEEIEARVSAFCERWKEARVHLHRSVNK
jgi:hypothetical protein